MPKQITRNDAYEMINILNDIKRLIEGGRKHHMDFVCHMIEEVAAGGVLSDNGAYLKRWILSMINKATCLSVEFVAKS